MKKVTKKNTKKTARKTTKKTKKTTTKMAKTKSAATKTKSAAAKTKSAAAKTKSAATKKTISAKGTTKSKARTAKTMPLTKVLNQTTAVKLGESVPTFEVPATGGLNVSLNTLKGKNVVLYFYPKDATPGCTLEGHEFTKLHDEFKQLNTEVFGVSRDDLNSHEKFKTKECYSIDLLSDTEGKLCNMFDVIKMKNMYGKQVQGIERSTFILDPDGKLVQEWRGVKAEGHAQQVLEFLKTKSAN